MRGSTLIIDKSQLYVRGVVVRDPLTLRTVVALKNRKEALRYCRRNGYSYMDPVDHVDMDRLEQKI